MICYAPMIVKYIKKNPNITKPYYLLNKFRQFLGPLSYGGSTIPGRNELISPLSSLPLYEPENKAVSKVVGNCI